MSKLNQTEQRHQQTYLPEVAQLLTQLQGQFEELEFAVNANQTDAAETLALGAERLRRSWESLGLRLTYVEETTLRIYVAEPDRNLLERETENLAALTGRTASLYKGRYSDSGEWGHDQWFITTAPASGGDHYRGGTLKYSYTPAQAAVSRRID